MYKEIERSINSHPKAESMYFMGTKYSFEDLFVNISKVEKSFLKIGIKENDIVCVALPNLPQTIFFVYALNKIGAIACMIHPLASEKEIDDCVSKTNPKVLIILDNLANIASKIESKTLEKIIITGVADELPLYKKIVVSFTPAGKKTKIKSNKFIRYKNFVDLSKHNNITNNYVEQSEKIALILSSGGTTGKPKYVCITNKNVDANVEQLKLQINSSTGNRLLCIMPMFHGNGAVTSTQFPLSVGICCIIMPRFTTKAYAKNLQKYKCNFLTGTPGLYVQLMREPLMKNIDLSQLLSVFCGADFLSEDTENKINKFLHDHNSKVTVRQGYGLTEGVAISTIIPDGIICHGSVGLPLNGVHLKIVKPNTDIELPIKEIGEIVFSSDTNMKGYLNDEEETNNILRKHYDGLTYVHSGDLGYVDEEGFVYFKGRIKRMIVTNGYNVFPVELENVIEGHNQVARCCILGIPDEQRGEKIVAYIQPKSKKLDEAELEDSIKEHVKKSVAKYSLPRKYYFIDKIPLTNIGKINYKKLLEIG